MKKNNINTIKNKIEKFIKDKKVINDIDSLSRKIHASPILVENILYDFERKGLIISQ